MEIPIDLILGKAGHFETCKRNSDGTFIIHIIMNRIIHVVSLERHTCYK